MKREILFRGFVKKEKGDKTIQLDGREIKGYWVYWDEYGECSYAYISNLADCVISKTVGEYTGLIDSFGEKIFEGDIVKITDKIVCYERLAVIEFGNPNGQYNWGWQLKPISKEPFDVDILNWVDMEETGAFIEVIGTVYENPELLKGGDKK